MHMAPAVGRSCNNSVPLVATSPTQSNTAPDASGASEHEKQDDLSLSGEEVVRQENANLLEALMQSKADVRSSDGVLVLRLTSNSDDLRQMLQETDHLSNCRNRVRAAGCEVCP